MSLKDINNEVIEIIFKSLESENYLWRTIDGISKETNLDPEIILRVIEVNRDKIIPASKLSIDGKKLFTTRKHFLKKASATQKILGVLKNRLA